MAFLCSQMVTNFLWLVPLIKGKTQSQQLEMRVGCGRDCSELPGHKECVHSVGRWGTAESKIGFLFHSYRSGKELFLDVNFNSFCQAFTQIASHVSGFPLLCSWGHRLRMSVRKAIWENMGATARCSGSRIGSESDGCMGKQAKSMSGVREKCWRGKELVSELQSR